MSNVVIVFKPHMHHLSQLPLQIFVSTSHLACRFKLCKMFGVAFPGSKGKKENDIERMGEGEETREWDTGGRNRGRERGRWRKANCRRPEVIFLAEYKNPCDNAIFLRTISFDLGLISMYTVLRAAHVMRLAFKNLAHVFSSRPFHRRGNRVRPAATTVRLLAGIASCAIFS